LNNLLLGQTGSVATEYSLVASLIAMAIIGAVTSLGLSVRDFYETLAGLL